MKMDPSTTVTAIGPRSASASSVRPALTTGASGYYAYADGFTAANQYVHTVATLWTVPNRPLLGYTAGRVFYAFPSIEDGGRNTTMQPVMQMDSTNGNWTMENYWVDKDGHTIAHSARVVVYPGEEIRG